MTTIDRKTLASALDLAAYVAPRRHNIPILTHARVASNCEAVTISATDLEQEISIRVPATANGAELDSAVSAMTLRDTVKKSTAEQVSIAAAGDSMTVAAGPARVSLKTQPIADWPNLAPKLPECVAVIPTSALHEALQSVRHAINTEETLYYLKGVYIHRHEGRLRFVACDGHRLACYTSAVSVDEFKPVILPGYAVETALRMLRRAEGDAVMEFNPARVTIECDRGRMGFTLHTKTIDGQFPDYNRVVSIDLTSALTVDRAEMIAAVKTITAIMTEGSRAVRLSLQPGDKPAKLSAKNPDEGETSIELNATFLAPAPLDIKFNARYILDALNAIASDQVIWQLSDAGTPAIIKGADDSHLWQLLMPMRI